LKVGEQRELYDEEQTEDDDTSYRAFSVTRGGRSPMAMLEFRLRTGHRTSLDYQWLFSMDVELGDSLILDISRVEVTITGRHLQPLASMLNGRQVRWIWEADQPTTLLVPEGEAVVASITIER
jgi:hypothetical protein